MARGIRLTLKITVTVVMFITAVRARYPNSAEGRVREYLLNQANFSSRNRPVLNSDDAVHVMLKMELYAMLDLNERDQVITTGSLLTLKWNDERLSWNPEDYNYTDLATMYVDEIWTPQISMVNSLKSGGSSIIPSSNQGQILLTSEGDVVFSELLIQSSQCTISIRYFPFDIQGCPFLFDPGNELAENVYLTVEIPKSAPTVQTSEWDLINISVHNFQNTVPYYVKNRPFGKATGGGMCAIFKRDPKYYLTTLVVPSSLLCLMSLATFLAPPDSGERISLGVSMVLGLTVFQLLIADILPTASNESPILSNYLSVTFILACLAIPFSLGNINVAYGDSRRLSTFHKHQNVRNIVLEYLPRVLCVPTYRERLENEVPKSTSNDVPETNQTDADESFNPTKVHPMESSSLNKKLSHHQTRKLVARTFAVVLDRLVLAGFLVTFLIVVMFTLVSFLQNPGMSYVKCFE